MRHFYSNKANRTRRKPGNGIAFGLNFEALEDRRMLAAVSVNTAADLVDGNTTTIASLIADPGADGAVSLREALAAADSSSATDTITFDASVFNGEAADVIRLQSQLLVFQSVEIDGGDLGVVVSGDSLGNDITEAGSFVTDTMASNAAGVLSDNTSRVFAFVGAPGGTASISGLTITGGVSSGSGGGILAESADLLLNQSVVSGNRSVDSGGGIDFGAGQLTIDQSMVSGNVVQSPTGLTNATGGGIAAGGDIVITSSTISGNAVSGESGQGGGVYSITGSLSISSSTVSGNVANSPFGVSAGGGILIGSQSTSISDSTITENTADFGGGISVGSPFAAVTLGLENSIVANNTALSASADIAAGFTVAIDASFSLIGDNNGTSLVATSGVADADGNLIGTSVAPIDPLLGALADNGGLTQTHAILTGSPATDAGSSSFDFDQRGTTRQSGLATDIGAFELQVPVITVDTSEGFDDGDLSAGNLSLPEAIALSNSTPELETIVFDSSVFNGEAADVIRLQQEQFITQSVVIDADNLDVVISGDRLGNDNLVPGTFISNVENSIAGAFDNVRPFNISTDLGEAVVLRSLTITGGFSEFEDGGGIASDSANLLIENSIVSGNFSNDVGGGISVENGSLTINNSDISNNAASGISYSLVGGGGIASFDSDVTITGSSLNRNFSEVGGGIASSGGTVTIVTSTISENSSFRDGGGISTFDTEVFLDRSTVSGNTTQAFSFNAGGGGISTNLGSLTVSNSTISGNLAIGGDGGGINAVDATITINDSTITENESDQGAGILVRTDFFTAETASLAINNSIIASNLNGRDISIDNFDGPVTVDINSSLIGNRSDSLLAPTPDGLPDANGNIIGDFFDPIDPLLGPLADNGGPTQTHALLVGSPAIDTGNTTSTIDQRGELRPNAGGNGPDIGAFEEQTLTLIVDTSNDLVDGDFSAGNRSLREAIGRANASEGVDRIFFAPEVFDGGAEDVIRLVNGELEITEGVVIDAGDLQIVVSGDSLNNDIVDSETFIVDIAASDSSGSLADNSRVFNIATSTGQNVSISGLTVTGGNTSEGGGGIAVSSAIVELAGVNILGNQSSGNGGGILTDSQLTLDDSIVSGNIASSGGGIAAGSSTVTVNNSTISDNLGSSLGAGISTTTGDVVLNSSVVSGNVISGGFAGGGIATSSGGVIATDSSIINNSSDIQGGGISTQSGVVQLIGSDVSGNQSGFRGGGIYVETGSVSLLESTLNGNTTSGTGGGISTQSGSVSITASTIGGNQSASSGGGIFSETGSVTLSESTLSGNSTTEASSDGGGAYINSGGLVFSSSTASGNSSTGRGGGLFIGSGAATLTSSTLSRNSAEGFGGGIYVDTAEISIFSSTVAFNDSTLVDGGGGLFNDSNVVASTFEIQNSIIASNTAAGVASDLRFDASDPLDLQFSLIGTNATTFLTAASVGSPDANGNLIGTSAAVIDPLLGALSNYGGQTQTQTHALLDDSPAIDSGSSTLTNDQRGIPFVRAAGNAVDIGAFESQSLQLIVGTPQDIVDGNLTSSQLSLREAVQLANSNPGEDSINFDPDQFRGSTFFDTIFLGLGELTISESVRIDGEDLGIIISGDANRNDFNVQNTDITNLNIDPGTRLDDNSGVFNITAPAGDLVTLAGLTVTGGIGDELGGISNGSADLIISRSNILGNRSSGSGGGIFTDSGSLTIDRSNVSDNRTLDVAANGGGIYSNSGDVTISFSTVSGNQTAGLNASGGGVYTVAGTISLALSTVSGNQTLGSNADGGGIATARGDLLLNSVTVTQNIAASQGGGVFVAGSTSNPAITISNTIIAGNDATVDQPDLGLDTDGFVDVQFSLIGDNTGTSLFAASVGSPDANGNLIGTAESVIDPLLGELTDNNGPSLTHELLPGSPAIDAGNSSVATDQRANLFLARNNGDGVDIGSYERIVFNLVVDTSSDIDDEDYSVGNLSLREALFFSNANSVTDTIKFDPVVFNGESADVIRLLDTLSISDGVIIDAAELGIVISGDTAGNDVLVAESNVTDTFASETNDTLDDNVLVIDISATTGETVSLSGLTVTGGVGTRDGGGIRVLDADIVVASSLITGNRTGRFGDGGGIYSEDGQLTLNDSIVSDNFSDDHGGGIHTRDGIVILNNSSVENNLTGSSGDGGGIHSVSSGDVFLNNSRVSNNTTGRFGDGGGVYARSGDVTLIDSTVSNNTTSVSSGQGGGIYSSSGDVSLDNSIVNNNTTGSSANGGGIYGGGDVTVVESSVSNNTAGEFADGGGIYATSGSVTLTDSTVAGNSTGERGAGAGIGTSSADITAIRSTISFNVSGEDGGGISTTFGDLLFINSTVSGNTSAGDGGGIQASFSDQIDIINSTITNNRSRIDGGGGLHFSSTSSSDTLTIENSILAGNANLEGTGPDLFYSSNIETVVRTSLIGSNSGTPLVATASSTPDADGNLIGTAAAPIDPLLGRLADNGGPTLTHGLGPGSPAIDAGGTASIDFGTTDQRGSDRVLNGQIDIGAFEGEISQIFNVILSSSEFSANFIDAIDGEGPSDNNGLGYSLVGEQQLTSVPWQNIDTLYLQFFTDVSASLDDGDILLTGTNGGDYSLGPISFDSDSLVATVPIVGGVSNDSLVISIFEGTVTDTGGQSVVGDDGGQFNFRFNVLPGDEDGSGQVNSLDASNVFASNTDLTIAENARRDIDGSGQITSLDAFAAFANNTNGLPSLPAAPVAPSAITSPLSVAAIDATSRESGLPEDPVSKDGATENPASLIENVRHDVDQASSNDALVAAPSNANTSTNGLPSLPAAPVAPSAITSPLSVAAIDATSRESGLPEDPVSKDGATENPASLIENVRHDVDQASSNDALVAAPSNANTSTNGLPSLPAAPVAPSAITSPLSVAAIDAASRESGLPEDPVSKEGATESPASLVENVDHDVDQASSNDALVAVPSNANTSTNALTSLPAAPVAPSAITSPPSVAAIDAAFSGTILQEEPAGNVGFAESSASLATLIVEPINEQSIPVPAPLDNPLTVDRSTVDPTIGRLVSEPYQLSSSAELKLAGHIEVEETEEAARDYFSNELGTTDELNPVALDSFFQEDEFSDLSLL